LNPDYFLGGKAKLYLDKAEKAIQEKIADKLNLTLKEAARGIYRVVNSNMVEGIRAVTISKGYDPRTCALVVAGGAGPIHACDIAGELDVPLILVPKQSSVFCAFGMLTSDLRHDLVRSAYMIATKESINLALVNSLFREMTERGNELLEREGIPIDKRRFAYSADLRYEAQMWELEVPIYMTDSTFSLEQLTEVAKAFDEKHETLYGYSMHGTPLELTCLRVAVEGITEKPSFVDMPYMGEDASAAIKAKRDVYYEGKSITAPVYDGTQLGYGHKLSGIAIIEQPTTTILLPPEHELTCDRYANYLLHRKGTSLEEILSKLRR